MNVEFYTGVDERLEMPMILPPVPDLVDFSETQVLIADDVADTGATLALVKEFLDGQGRRDPLRGALREAALDRQAASTSGGAPTAGSTSPGASGRP